MNARTGSHARFVHDWCGTVFELPEGWRDAASPGCGVARALPVRGGVAPLGRPSCGSVASLGLPSWGGVTSLCARTRGEPSSAHCEQRLSERLTPRPCDPVCACTGIRGHATKEKSGKTTQRGATQPLHFLSLTPNAAQRAVPGWRGGLGRVGADLASAGSMRPPPSPARHDQHGMARHHKSQPGNGSTTRYATTNASTTKTARRTYQRVHPAFMQPATQSAA